ncbi:MAG TPA: hypothetical protein VGC36_03485, partial [Rhizomicrobium sp.]
ARPPAPQRRAASTWLGAWWLRLLELLDHAPFGRPVAAASLLLATLLFVLSAVTGFVSSQYVPQVMALKVYLPHLFPGPSGAMLLLGMCVAPLTALTYVVDGAAGALTLFGYRLRLRYFPTLLVLLALLFAATDRMSLHAVRIVEDATAMKPAQRAPLAVLFRAWAERCAPGTGPVHPVIVAVSGGASRAGVWAARVLDVVDESVKASGSRSAAVFAVSSVSGGSLGAAAYLALRAGSSQDGAPADGICALNHVGADDDPVRNARDVDVIQALRADAIGPTLAGMVLGDAPRALASYIARPILWAHDKITGSVTVLRGNDRAEALERSFEYNWRTHIIAPREKDRAAPAQIPFGFDRPYLSLFYREDGAPRGDVPLWISNGTNVKTGDRLITAPFAIGGERYCRGDGYWAAPGDAACGAPDEADNWNVLGPFLAAADVLNILDADVPVSTAIDNTSRFPFLSPSGELTPAGGPARGSDAQIIDGGYFENEGIMSAMELARWLGDYGPAILGRPVYPIVVQATADADDDIPESSIPRCSNALRRHLPDLAEAAQAVDDPPRGSQFLVPLRGLFGVRGGHSRVLRHRALEAYCDEG